jgi:hypothetical protein
MKTETYYQINYLSKAHNFREKEIKFFGDDAYEKAVAWGKTNLSNFHDDLIKVKILNISK